MSDVVRARPRAFRSAVRVGTRADGRLEMRDLKPGDLVLLATVAESELVGCRGCVFRMRKRENRVFVRLYEEGHSHRIVQLPPNALVMDRERMERPGGRRTT